MTRPASLSTSFVASSRDDADSSLSALGSCPLSFHRRSHTGVEERHRAEKKPEKPCSDFQFHSANSNLYAGDLHGTMLAGERLRARRAREDVASLVDFLKNHPPPPDNFMSIPYEDDEHSRGRWTKIKTMGRRSKSMPKERQNMQLPDSAVAGVTTGGHRHIAISIPIEATPYGLEMRTQYPVFHQGKPMGTPSKESVRTIRNDKGVVTVLRPVTEVYESDTGSAASKSRSPNVNSQGQRPPPLPPHKPTNVLTGQAHDYIGILPTKFDTPLLDDSSAPWHISRSHSRDEGSVGKQNPAALRRTAYPARASSMVADRSVRHPPSIDGLISRQDQVAGASNGARPKYLNNSLAHARRAHSISNSQPVEKTTFDVRRSKSGPLHNGDMSPAISRNNSQTRNTASTTDDPVRSRTDDLSDLMVVMDVEPCSADEKGEAVRPKTAPAKKSPKESSDAPEAPSTTVKKPSAIPISPTSTRGSPSQQDGGSDRTSLTRRREWKAIKEQERRARDAMAMARARAQQLASSGVSYEKGSGSVSQADKEVMRLYEAYREHRLREMERRLRRLERNGDVWLQALVPVLDKMNQTMASSRDGPLEGLMDWACDGQTSGTPERTDEDMEKKRLTRRPSVSQARLLERLSGHTCNDDGWSDSVSRSDDASGLGTIEPLMRELAGEARRWQGTTQSPVMTNGGQFHAM